jgi:hypothetical protein
MLASGAFFILLVNKHSYAEPDNLGAASFFRK